MGATRRTSTVHFGPFQLDLRAGELRKGEARIRVPEQSLQVLAMLLEQPGEVVTREELREKLWPNGTVVEFDHSINTAIKKLRQALEDSAEEPKFIETLPRRGYRFLVSVERRDSAEAIASSVLEPDSGEFAGQTISHYRVLRKLGQGAMGVVYEARDTRLGRSVALKFLPEELEDDPQALERFAREARAASALNHPNICTLHDIGEADGRPFIAMEYLEGQTLGERIQAKPFKIDELLDLSIQITDALETAHSKAIIHRDIKPANIFITNRGQAKIMDFGVAKLSINWLARSAAVQHSEAATVALTQYLATNPSTAVGTAAYMSPEQARGEEADARSDLFSLGLVLYEMATGRPRQPDAPVGLPKRLDRIVGKALETEPGKRFQSAAEMRLALSRARDELESRSRRKWALTATASLVLIGSGLAWWMRYAEPAAQGPAPQVVPLTTSFGDVSDPAFSPDGNLIAYRWIRPGEDHSDIYVQQVGSTTPLRVTTEPVWHVSPAFSPDGRYIAHFHHSKLMLIPTFGGAERKIADLDGGDCLGWLDYAPDGKSVAVCERVNGTESIVRIAMDTGEKHRLTTPPPGQKDFGLRFSPDGQKAALVRGRLPIATDIYVISANGGEARRITADNNMIRGLAWTGDSREIVFGSDNADTPLLRRVAAAGGTPQPVAGASPGAGYPAISRLSHRLAYIRVAVRTSTRRLQLLQPGNRPGSLVKLLASARGDSGAQYSPDGRKIVFGSDRSGAPEVWVANADGSEALQLTTFGGPITGTPHWSPDGKRIVFDAWPEGNADIWIVNADGGSLRRVTTHPALDCVPNWSRDGQWIYFASDRTGDYQVWKVDPDTGRELQITHQGGFHAMESPDGNFLYFSKSRYPDTEVWKMPVSGGTEVAAMVSREGLPIKVAGWYYWDVFNDGIYFIQAVADSGSPPKPGPSFQIRFFHFKSRKSTIIRTLTSEPITDEGALRVSSDRRWMLFAQMDQNERNIMLVNNFR